MLIRTKKLKDLEAQYGVKLKRVCLVKGSVYRYVASKNNVKLHIAIIKDADPEIYLVLTYYGNRFDYTKAIPFQKCYFKLTVLRVIEFLLKNFDSALSA